MMMIDGERADAMRKLNWSLERLTYSEVLPVNESARKVRAMMGRGSLNVTLDQGMATPSSFGITEIPSGKIWLTKAFKRSTLFLDTDKAMAGGPFNLISGDLARTVVVISRYSPGQDMRALYADALNLQRQFLVESASDDIEFDPRFQSIDTIIDILLSDRRFIP